MTLSFPTPRQFLPALLQGPDLKNFQFPLTLNLFPPLLPPFTLHLSPPGKQSFIHQGSDSQSLLYTIIQWEIQVAILYSSRFPFSDKGRYYPIQPRHIKSQSFIHQGFHSQRDWCQRWFVNYKVAILYSSRFPFSGEKGWLRKAFLKKVAILYSSRFPFSEYNPGIGRRCLRSSSQSFIHQGFHSQP